MAWPAGRNRLCHGAHSGEGPVLDVLAMLALKDALRVAPGGSAPLFPFAPRHGPRCSGRDGKAGASAEPQSRVGVSGDPTAAPKRGHSRCAETGDILALR